MNLGRSNIIELSNAYCVAEYCTFVKDDKYAMNAAEAMPLAKLSADTTPINTRTKEF